MLSACGLNGWNPQTLLFHFCHSDRALRAATRPLRGRCAAAARQRGAYGAAARLRRAAAAPAAQRTTRVAMNDARAARALL